MTNLILEPVPDFGNLGIDNLFTAYSLHMSSGISQRESVCFGCKELNCDFFLTINQSTFLITAEHPEVH